MNSVEVNLLDAETGEEYKLQLSPKSAIRAQTDLSFATTLLNVARQTRFQNTACLDTSEHMQKSVANDTTLKEIPEGSEHMQEDSNDLLDEMYDDMNTFSQEKDISTENKENFRWSHAAIMLLLEEYRSRESSMSSGKTSQKKVWDEIATIMNSKRYDVSSRQCMTRINTMKRTYKTIKDHNSRSGNNKHTWKYYDAMESFLGEKHYMSPLTLISSTGKSSFAKSESPSSSSSSSTCQSDGKVVRKRKAADIIDNITENRRVTEDGKIKRHKERMEMQQKFIERLDEILKKL